MGFFSINVTKGPLVGEVDNFFQILCKNVEGCPFCRIIGIDRVFPWLKSGIWAVLCVDTRKKIPVAGNVFALLTSLTFFS